MTRRWQPRRARDSHRQGTARPADCAEASAILACAAKDDDFDPGSVARALAHRHGCTPCTAAVDAAGLVAHARVRSRFPAMAEWWGRGEDPAERWPLLLHHLARCVECQSALTRHLGPGFRAGPAPARDAEMPVSFRT